MRYTEVSRDYFSVVKLIRSKMISVRKEIDKYEEDDNLTHKLEAACGVNQICDLMVKIQYINIGYTLNSINGKNLSWPQLIAAGKTLGYDIIVPDFINENTKEISSWIVKTENQWVKGIKTEYLESLQSSLKEWFLQVCV